MDILVLEGSTIGLELEGKKWMDSGYSVREGEGEYHEIHRKTQSTRAECSFYLLHKSIHKKEISSNERMRENIAEAEQQQGGQGVTEAAGPHSGRTAEGRTHRLFNDDGQTQPCKHNWNITTRCNTNNTTNYHRELGKLYTTQIIQMCVCRACSF